MATTALGLPVVTRADDVPGPPQGGWTYADYAAIPDDGSRYEVIDGVLYLMPSANTLHQRTVGRFFRQLDAHVTMRGVGEVFLSPYDVELGIETVVQPDLVVVLAATSQVVTDSRIVGAPDIVIEIASPSTATYDRRTKLEAYARARIPEYWLVDAAAKTIELLQLERGEYRSLGLFQGGAVLPSRVLPDLAVPVEEFFV